MTVVIVAEIDRASVSVVAVGLGPAVVQIATRQIAVVHRLAVATDAFAFDARVVRINVARRIDRRRNLSASIVNAFVDFTIVFVA